MKKNMDMTEQEIRDAIDFYRLVIDINEDSPDAETVINARLSIKAFTMILEGMKK